MTSTRATAKPIKTSFRIQVQNRQRRFKVLKNPIASICAGALRALGQNSCALTVAFVGIRAIKRMNGQYRNRNYPTDVLSFSYGREWDEDMPYLGDIVISVDVACGHAVSRRILPDSEIRRLLVHGVLHLLGYDHETDSGEMVRLQRRLLRRRSVVDVGPVLAGAGHSARRRSSPW